jgi:sporulation protein YlmC with PRC-barrel domain
MLTPDGPVVGNMEEIVDSDIASDNSQSVGMVEDLKLNDRCGNVIENKGSLFHNSRRSGNVIENKGSYAKNAGMLLKIKGAGGIS